MDALTTLFILAFLALAAACVVFLWMILKVRKRVDALYGGVRMDESDVQLGIIRRLLHAEAKLEEIEPRMTRVEDISHVSVQKVGFLRFNPFEDTGGDNSFVLALLDRENNGVIVSSLYARDGMRIFAKRIEKGRTTHQLSDEEKKVLEETLQKNF